MCDCFGVDLLVHDCTCHVEFCRCHNKPTRCTIGSCFLNSAGDDCLLSSEVKVGRWESISLTQIHLIPVPAGFIDSHTSPLSRMFRFIKGLCVQKWKCYVTQNFGSYISFFFSETKMSKMLFSVQRKHNAISGWSFSDWTKKNYKNHFSIINVLL